MYASCVCPKDHFNQFVEYCYANLGDFAKLAINSMIGAFKPRTKRCFKVITPLITDKNNAFYHYLSDKGSYIHTVDIDDQTYYQVSRE